MANQQLEEASGVGSRPIAGRPIHLSTGSPCLSSGEHDPCLPNLWVALHRWPATDSGGVPPNCAPCLAAPTQRPLACLGLHDVEQLVQVSEDPHNHLVLSQFHLRVVAVGAVVDDAVLWVDGQGRRADALSVARAGIEGGAAPKPYSYTAGTSMLGSSTSG